MDMKAIKRCWRYSVVATFAIAWVAVASPVLAEPVAMVTDIEGGNSVTGMGESTELSLLAELEPGGSVDLAGGSRLVIVYYDSGNEFIFEGPASITL